MGRQLFSESFKKQAVEKFFNRGEKSVEAIAKEVGASTFSLYGWAKSMSKASSMNTSSVQSVDKFEAILSFLAMPQSKQGEYLRSKGFTTDQLELWKKEIKSKLDLKTSSAEVREISQAKVKVRQLEKEIRRKDKVLAETTALLVLSKKAEALWGVAFEED